MAPPAAGHARAPLIPPPTVLTLLARHFHAPPHRGGSESPSPASYRPRPRSLHSAPCGLGPRSSRACPWLRPSFPQLRPRASRRRFQEATPTTSSRAPRLRPPCPLRSLAPPLEAPFGLQAQCGGGASALCRPRACSGAAAWRLCKVFLPRCSSDPLPERETTPTETRLKAGGLRLGNICLPQSEHASPTQ